MEIDQKVMVDKIGQADAPRNEEAEQQEISKLKAEQFRLSRIVTKHHQDAKQLVRYVIILRNYRRYRPPPAPPRLLRPSHIPIRRHTSTA
jgi:hypothetical protein